MKNTHRRARDGVEVGVKGEDTDGGVGVLRHVEGDVGHRGERSSTTGEPITEVRLARLSLLGPGWAGQDLLGPGWARQGLLGPGWARLSLLGPGGARQGLPQDQDQEDRTIPPPSKLSSIL